MEPTNGHAFESFDPDEPTDEIKRVSLSGWIKIRTHSGKVQVLNVQTVRLLDSWSLEIARPGRPPLYHWGYLGKTVEPISEEEAHAWLAKHEPTRPGPEEVMP